MAVDPIRIGKYRVIRKLGQGAQGAVYLAQRDQSAHLSVVKQRHGSSSDVRFRREAQICALLEHKNIARLEAAVFDGDEAYLAFEDVLALDVQTIYERHRQLGRSIPAAVVLHILDGVLTGLDFAHSALESSGKPAGLVHRDLNFRNVMVGFDGVPKIIDFGLARTSGGVETKPGFAVGTPAYMPPEFLTLGAQAASPASDVYSAGLLAYDLLMAIDYDVSRGDLETFWQWIMNPTPLPSLREHRPDVPPAAAEAIERAFRPRIQDRWPTARAFLDALRAAVPPAQRLSEVQMVHYLDVGFHPEIAALQADLAQLLVSDPGSATGIAPALSSTGEVTKLGAESAESLMDKTPSDNRALDQTPADPSTLVVRRKTSDPAPAPAITLTPPPLQRLGKYSLLKRLAEGGMGQVYLARRDGSDDLCVLKTLRPDVVGDETSRRRFVREAQVAALLQHANVARLLDAGSEDGTFCLTMEYIPGKDLESMMHELYAQRRLLPFPVSLSAMIGVLDGLEHAHTALDPQGRPLGIVHRDLSPRNMMLTFEGVAKVIDFGVARAKLDDFKTAPGMVMGTFRYVSPEMARAETIDRRSDIYAAGVVLYELLSGLPVVTPSSVAVDMLRSVVSHTPDTLSSVAPSIPAALSDAVMRAIQKRPSDRWQSAAEFRAALVAAVPDWAHTPKPVLAEFLRTWFKADAEQAAAIVELSHLREPSAERTRTFMLGEDAVEPTAVVPVAEFAEVEEVLATKTGLVFPPAPELTRSVVVERTQALPTRIIDARSQPEAPAHVSVKPVAPSMAPGGGGANVKLIALSAALGGAVVMLLVVLVVMRLTQQPVTMVAPPQQPSVSASAVPSVVRGVEVVPAVSPSAAPTVTAAPLASRRPQPSPPPRTSPPTTTSAAPASPTPTPRAPSVHGDPELAALAARLRSSTAENLARDPAFPRFVERATELAGGLSGDARSKAMRKIATLQAAASVEGVEAVVGATRPE
ncbi:MAG: protein kinase [Myxococcota bacterium]